MPGDACIVCGSTRSKDPGVSLHRFPANETRRAAWLCVFQLQVSEVKSYTRVCCRHFPRGDITQDPQTGLGKRFASPKKKGTPRAKRAKTREVTKHWSSLLETSAGHSRSATPLSKSPTPIPGASEPLLTASIGEPLESEYSVHELPTDSSETSTSQAVSQGSAQVLVNKALLAQVEFLQSENRRLKEELKEVTEKPQHFRVEHIKHSDNLVRFYTGFISYVVYQAFFMFLGPVVNHLNYWGGKEGPRHRRRTRRLDPENQLFLTLVKLRLNLKHQDLAFRFGISESVVSRYLTTWICFLFQHLKEIEWAPSVQQVAATLPLAFKDKYESTYAIIDGSEIFLETPSDLYMQSSTWSEYKHNNTGKFLVACTPNGAISFVSPLYVGAISDVELTRVSGFLTKLEDKPGVSIMADRGFTIKDMLKDLGIDLNLPPFMEGRKQLPAAEVQEGRSIAHLRIHVERGIGRKKNFRILTGKLPISMARLANQIVCVCAFLSNFHPALVPVPTDPVESDVEEYFQCVSSNESEYDGDSEYSD